MKPTLKGGFWATGSSGDPLLVQLWQTWTDGPRGPIEDHVNLQLEDGSMIKRLDKGRYEIVLTGEELTSDNPSAP